MKVYSLRGGDFDYWLAAALLKERPRYGYFHDYHGHITSTKYARFGEWAPFTNAALMSAIAVDMQLSPHTTINILHDFIMSKFGTSVPDVKNEIPQVTDSAHAQYPMKGRE